MMHRPDVDSFLAEISAEQLQEWRAFFRIEPFGPYRDAVHAAVIASTVARANGAKVKLSDFIAQFGETKRNDDWVRVARAWAESRAERVKLARQAKRDCEPQN
jgi:hypothetical protein